MLRRVAGKIAGQLTAKHGPLGVFVEYPVLLQLGLICTCAETAWATLLAVMEYYFKEELLVGNSAQYIASKIAVAFLAFAGAETLFKYPMGSLADKFGPRRFILLALGVCTFTPIGMTVLGLHFKHLWWAFVPLRALDGFAAAALWPAMSALMARSVPKEAKAAAMSVFNAAYCLGLAVGPMSGLFLGHVLHTNLKVFPICAVLMATGFLIAFRFVPQTRAGEFHGENLAEERALLRGRPMLVRMMALYAFSQIAVGILAPTIPLYLDTQFGLEQKDLPKLIAGPAVLIVVMAIPLGRLADSIGRAFAVWLSYAMAAGGMILIALTSRFEPTHDLTSLPMFMFAGGILLMIGSYILGTPAWLGLTSLQVEDSRQAQVLSMMQAAQGLGVVAAFSLVASAGHLMAAAYRVTENVNHRMHFKHHKLHLPPAFNPLNQDPVPIAVWFWVAACIFGLCLVGTLLWVREPPHTPEAEENAGAGIQPLELRGL